MNKVLKFLGIIIPADCKLHEDSSENTETVADDMLIKILVYLGLAGEF